MRTTHACLTALSAVGLCTALSAHGDVTDSPTILFDCNGVAAIDDGGRPGFVPGEWYFEGDCVGNDWRYSYEISAILDPVLDFDFTWTNTSSQSQSYVFTFELFDIEDWQGDIAYSGLLNATVHDLNGNGALLSSFSNMSLFTGYVDGISLMDLATSPFSLAAAPGGSASIGTSGSGTAGSGYADSLKVRLAFTLSAGDSVTFGGDWTVNSVPAPGALALLLGAMPFCGRGRRR